MLRILVAQLCVFGMLACGDTVPLHLTPSHDGGSAGAADAAGPRYDSGLLGDVGRRLDDVGHRLNDGGEPSADAGAPAMPELPREVCADAEAYLSLRDQLFENPAPGRRRTEHPIILHHGMAGFIELGPLSYFSRIPEHLRGLGYEVYLTQVEPVDSSEVRAATLVTQIRCLLRLTGHQKVHLVGHSQGGIDARLIAADTRYGERLIASVTTVATPHRGSAAADAYLALAPGATDPLVDALMRVYGRIVGAPRDEAHLRAQVEAVSSEAMQRFNDEHPDNPHIAYRSWAGRSVPSILRREFGDEECRGGVFANRRALDVVDLLFGLTWQVIRARDGANDGMVSVRSARWGEFQGCVAADHMDEVGLLADPRRDPISGFESFVLFERIAEALENN
jgi:triacylglycerol lipase